MKLPRRCNRRRGAPWQRTAKGRERLCPYSLGCGSHSQSPRVPSLGAADLMALFFRSAPNANVRLAGLRSVAKSRGPIHSRSVYRRVILQTLVKTLSSVVDVPSPLYVTKHTVAGVGTATSEVLARVHLVPNKV